MEYKNPKQLDKNSRFYVKNPSSDHSSDSNDSLESSTLKHEKEVAKITRIRGKKKTIMYCPHQVQKKVMLIAKKLTIDTSLLRKLF